MAVLIRAGAAALLLCGLAGASAAEGPVGEVVQAAPRVQGRLAGKPPADLTKRSPVFVGMEVRTFARAGARLAINQDLRQQKGAVVLGPRTTIELSRRVVNQALGLEEMSWLVKLGQFRLALDPPPPGAPLAEGEYLIVTPTAEVRLRGTDVAVQVARDGTTIVWVIEGEVEVTGKAGGSRMVAAGHRTRVRPGREPEPPVPFGPAGGPGPGLLPHPEETIFPDPPGFDLRRLRLDLPQ